MARYNFGQGVADFVVTPTDGIWAVAPDTPITFWTEPVEGTAYTDLLSEGGIPVTSIASDEYGQIPRFAGPTGVTGMWADAGGPSRAWVEAHGALPTHFGVYVPPGWGTVWKAQRAASGLARIVVAGDSLSQGYFASDLTNSSWVGLVRQALQTQYGDGGSGFYSTSRSSAVMSASAGALAAWEANNSIATLTGTWTLGALNFGPGITFIQAAAAATATFQVSGSIVKIFNISGAAPRAGFTYTIDGGAAVPVPVTIGPTGVQVTTVTGLTEGEHTVTIGWDGAVSEILYLVGVAGENTAGVVVDNLARAGSRSSHWANGNILNSPYNGGTGYPADLVICSLGLNDAANAVTGADWSANMGTYLRAVRAAHDGETDILLLLHHIGDYGSTAGAAAYHTYAAQFQSLAAAYGAATVNLWAQGRNSWDYWNGLGYWGDGTTPGPAGTDLVHASDAGHAYIASQVLPILTS
ncbi:SGNH/GDSL hydrolase family protein [Streptomyces sp. NPDC020755]|uniref:SGNH/GDSL hydrolase family protein n=1 Tax=Streptomyces sp. NPDC020755 TaxID=3154790 RepID=UPI0033FA99B2